MSDIQDNLPLDKRTLFTFAVSKSNYKGKYRFEISSENCKDIKTDNKIYDNTPNEILNPLGTIVSFIPTNTGQDIVKIKLTVYDDWGMKVEKNLVYSVENTGINVSINNIESQLYVNQTTRINLLAEKTGHTENLQLEIKPTLPDQETLGELFIDKEPYTNGNKEISVDTPIEISYIPRTEGKISFEIIVTDKFGGKNKKTIDYLVSNPPIKIETSNFVSSATFDSPSIFNFAVSKEHYNSQFKYTISTIPQNAGIIKVDNSEYDGSIRPVENPDNTKIEFTPTALGQVILKITISDQTGKKLTKEYNYTVTNTPINLLVTNQETGLTINKTTAFNFAINKPGYSGTFLYEITSDPVVGGVFSVNGTQYLGGKTPVTSNNSTRVEFTPTIIGDINLILTIYDEYGGNVEKELHYTVMNSTIDIILSNVERNILLGKETSFNFSTIKPNYSGNYYLEITQLPDKCGEIKINNNLYEGEKQKILIPAATTIQYTSYVEGQNTLSINITDEHGGQTTKNVVFNSSNPSINLNVTNKEKDLIINTQTKFNLDISKDFYQDLYYLNIDQIPANSGEITINSKPYNGSTLPIDEPDNILVGFIPRKEGNITLKVNIDDKVKGKCTRDITFHSYNPEIEISTNQYQSNIPVNTASLFNFFTHKPNYDGKLFYQISQNPANTGTILVNDTPYKGGKLPVIDPNNNIVSFTPGKTGAVTLNLSVYDEWGKVKEQAINFSVANTDITCQVSNNERELILNKKTSFNFNISKPNYSGNFNASIVQEPEDAGTITINSQKYTSGEIVVEKNNQIEFIPSKTGAILLKLAVKDELSGTREVPVNFNVSNPPVNITVSNKENDLTINTPTRFNLAISKDFYEDDFTYFIEQEPVNSGRIIINEKEYNGGEYQVSDPRNMLVTFTPQQEGHVTLKVKIKDKVQASSEKNLDFEVTNPVINIAVTNHAPDMQVNSKSSFNFIVNKSNYHGKFYYQISQNPANSGTILVNDTPYEGGKLPVIDPNNNIVSFTPGKTGAVTLNLSVYDEWGKVKEQAINFSVANTDITCQVSNNERELILNKKTSFNFNISKPNYSGNFYTEIQLEPKNSGEIKINNKQYSSGEYKMNSINNIEFLPTQIGISSLKFITKDDLGGMKEIKIIHNISNPPIKLKTTNKQDEIIFKTPTYFNLAVEKDFYPGDFDYVVEQIPETSGTVTVDGEEYSGGKNTVKNTENTRIGFTPEREGRISLKVTLTDKVGGKISQVFDFNVKNPELELNVNGQTPDIPVNAPTSFNFNVKKDNYPGKFNFQITCEPSNPGAIKVNDSPYNGGIVQLVSPNDNTVQFTPDKPGAVVLKLACSDEWGAKSEKIISYSVSNTSVEVNVTNKELDLILNKPTTFNFTVSKPGYSKGFKAKFSMIPENSGTIKLNNSAYDSGEVALLENNSLSFTPTSTGATMIKMTVIDELKGEKEVALNFNVSNPPIKLEVTNKQDEIIFKTPTYFNLAVEKDFYPGDFDYVVEQIPETSGTVTVDGEEYSGGKNTVKNTENTRIGFTPEREGRISLKVTLTDKVGGKISQVFDFNVKNPELELNVNGQTPDVPVNTPTSFNFNVKKSDYTGKFNFQITCEPSNPGTIKVNDSPYNGGIVQLASPNDNTVEFTPDEPGAIVLKLACSDEWGSKSEEIISYSVSNTNMEVNVTNKELDLILNKPTTFNFTVSKPGYSKGFKAKFSLLPENSGAIKLNNSVYDSGEVSLLDNNSISFTPTSTGAIMIRMTVIDELKGEKDIALNFNVSNPPIKLDVTNKTDNIIYNTTTGFNVTISKERYSGKFNCRLSTIPANAGTISLDSKTYTGGFTPISNPQNLRVDFTPKQDGTIMLIVEIIDDTNNTVEKICEYHVENPMLDLTINNAKTELQLGEVHNFSITASKTHYDASYNYQITQYPYGGGTISVDNKNEMSGKLAKNPCNITFVPNLPGIHVLNIKITDEWGQQVEKQINYSVENTPITLEVLNNEKQIVLNTPTIFNFKALKKNYNDNETLTYTITPTSAGTLLVDNKIYNGTSISIPYSRIKNGIPVSFTPTHEGITSLTIHVVDQYNMTSMHTIDFNVTNPKLELNLVGVNLDQPNLITLGETFKYAFTIQKPYIDDFAYTITLNEGDAGLLATTDVSPRTRAAGSNILTGIIQTNEFGICIGEIRLTPNNSAYLNKDITVSIQIHDKWNNTKTLSSKFHIESSTINVNVNRSTSIPVETPYVFSYTVDKPNYTGDFKYSFIGFSNTDKLETSSDGKTYTPYEGGKYPVPDKNHTFIRFTPSQIGTIPLRLYLYDDNNSETVKELNFDVKAPEVKLIANRTSASGYTDEYIPFKITANEEKGEDVSLSFTTESTTFEGKLRFNNSEVTPTSKGRTTSTVATTSSGKENTLEIASRRIGNFAVTTTARNRYESKATVTTSVSVTEKPEYLVTTSAIGSGSIIKNPTTPTYQVGSTVKFTATPDVGWKFVRWQGSVTGTANPVTTTINGEMNVVAVFQKNMYKLTTNVTGSNTNFCTIKRSPDQIEYEAGTVVTLTAIPNPDDYYSIFDKWSEDNKEEISISVVMDDNKTISANFTSALYLIKVWIGNFSKVVMPSGSTPLKSYDIGNVPVSYLLSKNATTSFDLSIPFTESYKEAKVRIYIDDKLIALEDLNSSIYSHVNNENNVYFSAPKAKIEGILFKIKQEEIKTGKLRIEYQDPERKTTVTGTIVN